MLMTAVRALAWYTGRLLGIPEQRPLRHEELPHAHWDPISRHWLTHEHASFTPAQAA